VRTETNKLVTDLVNLDRVRSLLKTISCRRRFLAYKEHLHQQGTFTIPLGRCISDSHISKEIPSIVVESLSEGSPRSPSLSVIGGYDTSGYGVSPGSPTPDRRFHTPDVSLALDGVPKLQRSSRRTSDISMLSTDLGYASQFVCFPLIGLDDAEILVTDEVRWSKQIHKMFFHPCTTQCGEVGILIFFCPS
jgi:hypothetical protein